MILCSGPRSRFESAARPSLSEQPIPQSRMRMDGGDPGTDTLPLHQGSMPHQNAEDVGDGIEGTGQEHARADTKFTGTHTPTYSSNCPTSYDNRRPRPTLTIHPADCASSVGNSLCM